MKTELDVPSGMVHPVLLTAVILVIATTLRAPILGVGPLIQSLQSEFNLTTTMAGFLTTLPLIALGLIAPFAGNLAKVFGFEKTIFFALLIMVSGIILRSMGQEWQLYSGTLLIGVSIAVGNVLLPGMVKRDFSDKVASITGKYGVAIGVSAAVTSATAIPLMNRFGWQVALACTLIFPVLGLALLYTRLDKSGKQAVGVATPVRKGKSVWSSWLAWQVTIFMSINSIIFYALVTWLPSVLTDAGNSKETAGSIHGFMQCASIVPGLILGSIVARRKDQKFIAAVLCLFQCVALLGFALFPDLSYAWAFMFGMGSGGALILSLMFIGLRSTNPQQAASLSGMAQCVNFLIGAFGPAVAGRIHTLTGDWSEVLYIGVFLSLVMVIFGVCAGRNLKIQS